LFIDIPSPAVYIVELPPDEPDVDESPQSSVVAFLLYTDTNLLEWTSSPKYMLLAVIEEALVFLNNVFISAYVSLLVEVWCTIGIPILLSPVVALVPTPIPLVAESPLWYNQPLILVSFRFVAVVALPERSPEKVVAVIVLVLGLIVIPELKYNYSACAVVPLLNGI